MENSLPDIVIINFNDFFYGDRKLLHVVKEIKERKERGEKMIKHHYRFYSLKKGENIYN